MDPSVPHHRYVLWLGLLVVALALLGALFGERALRNVGLIGADRHVQPLDESGVRIAPEKPVATASDTIEAQQNAPFHAFVSYVNSGFEPRRSMITAGQTVRFTNNSTHPLRIVSFGDVLYPADSGTCGPSALDSCRALNPGEYWQFTFEERGTWQFRNSVDQAGEPGEVLVQ